MGILQGHLIKFKALCKTVVLSLVVWLSILPWLPFFALYRIIIDVILRLKHGETYGGLFDMSDCLFFMPDATKCTMTGIFYVKSDSEINLFEVMRKVIQEKVFIDPRTYPKLTSTKHDFGGYPYWLKNGVSVDDTIKPLQTPQDKVLTEEYLKELTAEISMKEYPKNEAVLWEFYVSEKSLDDENVSTSYRYPVIVRIHHSICDGTSLIALFIRMFGDESSQNYGEELFKTLFKGRSGENNRRSAREVIKMSLSKFIETPRHWLELILMAPGRAIEENQLQPTNQNALRTPACSGEKVVAWAVEEYVECIPLVKKIRRKTNSKFMSVVCTAISASMTDYFKRNPFPIPDYTSGAIAHLIDFPSIDPSKPVKLENKTLVCLAKLPTNKQPNTLIETVKEIDEIMKQKINYANSMISRFFASFVFGLVPVKLFGSTIGFNNHTFLITNVPGGSQIKALNGCVFEKVIGVAPNFRGVGFTLTLLSYDDRFQIGIMVDKAITTSQKEVQRIADDILYYIKVMDAEVRKIYGE